MHKSANHYKTQYNWSNKFTLAKIIFTQPLVVMVDTCIWYVRLILAVIMFLIHDYESQYTVIHKVTQSQSHTAPCLVRSYKISSIMP